MRMTGQHREENSKRGGGSRRASRARTLLGRLGDGHLPVPHGALLGRCDTFVRGFVSLSGGAAELRGRRGRECVGEQGCLVWLYESTCARSAHVMLVVDALRSTSYL